MKHNTTQGHHARTITIGSLYRLKGHRSHINGRVALTVTVTCILGDNDNSVAESRHPSHRFIATDGRREFYGLSRKDLLEIKA